MLTKKYFKTVDEVEVTFEFNRKNAESVKLVADFNDWQPLSMKFNKTANVYKAKVRLPKGNTFQFKYLVNDDEWENDFKADCYVPNAFGSENSVVAL